MPRQYAKSEVMKKDILRVAEHLFKEYGYDKTTYQMIADELAISKASISYHFKAKSWILFTLFKDYMASLYTYIHESIGNDYNCYLYHCIGQIFFYRLIMRHKNNWALFYHKDYMAIWKKDQITTIEDYYKEIMIYFRKEFTEEEIHATAVMNYGAKLAMFEEFSQSDIPIDVDQYCYYFVYFVGLLSKLDEATIVNNIRYAFEFADTHTPPTIDLLTWA